MIINLKGLPRPPHQVRGPRNDYFIIAFTIILRIKPGPGLFF
jgi:hypothetical protein